MITAYFCRDCLRTISIVHSIGSSSAQNVHSCQTSVGTRERSTHSFAKFSGARDTKKAGKTCLAGDEAGVLRRTNVIKTATPAQSNNPSCVPRTALIYSVLWEEIRALSGSLAAIGPSRHASRAGCGHGSSRLSEPFPSSPRACALRGERRNSRVARLCFLFRRVRGRF